MIADYELLGRHAARALNAGDKASAESYRAQWRAAQGQEPADDRLQATVAYHRGYAAARVRT